MAQHNEILRDLMLGTTLTARDPFTDHFLLSLMETLNPTSSMKYMNLFNINEHIKY